MVDVVGHAGPWTRLGFDNMWAWSWLPFLDGFDALRVALMRMVHDPWLLGRMGYHTRRMGWWRRVAMVLSLLSLYSSLLVRLPRQSVRQVLILRLELPHVHFLLLKDARVMLLTHFGSDRTSVMEG